MGRALKAKAEAAVASEAQREFARKKHQLSLPGRGKNGGHKGELRNVNPTVLRKESEVVVPKDPPPPCALMYVRWLPCWGCDSAGRRPTGKYQITVQSRMLLAAAEENTSSPPPVRVFLGGIGSGLADLDGAPDVAELTRRATGHVKGEGGTPAGELGHVWIRALAPTHCHCPCAGAPGCSHSQLDAALPGRSTAPTGRHCTPLARMRTHAR
jgi:hypothetical protein